MTELTRNQKEYKLQVHIAKRHVQYFPHVVMTHIPNRPSSSSDGHFKKQMGMRAGVTDIAVWYTFPYPNWAIKWLAKMLDYLGFSFSRMHGGMIELKVDTEISPEQNKFMSAIHSLGGKQGMVRTWRAYYKLLCSWGIKPIEECTDFDEPDYHTFEDEKKAVFDMYKP